MFEFVKPKVSTLRFYVYVDEDGNISNAADYFSKKFRKIEGFTVDGTLTDAYIVLDNLYGEGSYDPLSIKKVTVFYVAEIAVVDIHFTQADIQPIFDGSYSTTSLDFADGINAVFNGSYQLKGNVFSADDIQPIFKEA